MVKTIRVRLLLKLKNECGWLIFTQSLATSTMVVRLKRTMASNEIQCLSFLVNEKCISIRACFCFVDPFRPNHSWLERYASIFFPNYFLHCSFSHPLPCGRFICSPQLMRIYVKQRIHRHPYSHTPGHSYPQNGHRPPQTFRFAIFSTTME